ncbi:MAG: hypothetical protein RLZZ252_350 [Bacteroidota bacterium]
MRGYTGLILRCKLLFCGMMATFAFSTAVHSTSLDSNTTPTSYKAHTYLTSSELLQNQFRELAKLHPNYSSLVLPPNNRKTPPPAPLKKRFKIVHIGDSHIQNDILSDAIRQQFQQHFGNAGCGYLFPYGLAKSYGPRGISARTTGVWIDYKTMTPSLDRGLGITGYGLTSYTPNASIHLNFSDKFKAIPYQRIKVWHSLDSTSFDISARSVVLESSGDLVSQDLPLIYSDAVNRTPARSWGQSTFPTMNKGSIQSLSFEFNRNNAAQTHVDFYGFQLESANNSGVEYQSYGVVGSQFTHFIKNAGYAIQQLEYVQPNIIIFSFGTNEAYNGKLIAADYYITVHRFLDSLQQALPNTAIVIANCQDTRSNGKIPPKQKEVNYILRELAYQRGFAYFDLNSAMGGWNSIYRWQQLGLTLKDRVHFTGAGYSLQGKMIASALLEEYNQSTPLPIDIDALDNEIDSFASLLRLKSPTNFNGISSSEINEQLWIDSVSTQNKPKTSTPIQPNKPSPKSVTPKPTYYKDVVHTVKSGESLYRIALRYNVTVDAIVKKNHLRNPKAIKPGQKLLIPRR